MGYRRGSTSRVGSAAAAVFGHWFGLGPVEADVLAELWRRRGAPATAAELAQASGSVARSIAFHICSIRKALDTEGIDGGARRAFGRFSPGRGYWLTEVGLEELSSAIRGASDELSSELAA